MSHLFSPLQIKSLQLKNRIVVSPMCEYSSVDDGYATDWHLVHLGARAVGGASLIIQEATAVSAEGRITAADLGIYHDGHIEKLKQITDFIRAQGAVAGIQLAHAGRKASHAIPWKGNAQLTKTSGGWETVSASAIPFAPSEESPVALDHAGIQKVLQDFTQAAHRAVKAGYEVAEIHAAHGYLVHQFYSPLSNTRTDQYGGSFENRVRLLMEIVQAVQTAWPAQLPLFVRISSTDWTAGGWTEDDSVRLSGLLKSAGVDLIDCSSGGNIATATIPLRPGYQVPFAEKIKKETGILTGSVGLITTAAQAEEIIANGQADLILLAREMLRDPYFPLHAAHALKQDVAWPVQYDRAKLKLS